MTEELVKAEQEPSDQEMIDLFYGKGTPAAETINALANWERKNKGILQARTVRLEKIRMEQEDKKSKGYDQGLEFNAVEKPLAPSLTFLVDRTNEIIPEGEKIVGKRRGSSDIITFSDFDQAVKKLEPYLGNLRAAGKYLSPKQ